MNRSKNPADCGCGGNTGIPHRVFLKQNSLNQYCFMSKQEVYQLYFLLMEESVISDMRDAMLFLPEDEDLVREGMRYFVTETITTVLKDVIYEKTKEVG